MRRRPAQLPIPPAAVADRGSVEMIRGWIADERLHISLNIGVWEGRHDVVEERAWGILLADATRHIADALFERYGIDRGATIRAVKDELDAELDQPTSAVSGRFVEPFHDDED